MSIKLTKSKKAGLSCASMVLKGLNMRDGIFYFSPISYDHFFQRPQQLVNAWRETVSEQYDVFYVDPPIFINYRYAMAHLKLFPGLLVHGRPHSSDPNKDPYRIFSWFSIPCSVAGFRAFERANRWLRGDALRAAIEGTDCKIAVVGAAFWEPFISRDDFDVISYDYLDSIDILLRNPYLPRSSLKLQHERLITKSDFVFAASDALKEEVQAIATDIPVCTVTNGVDFSFFERNRYDPRVGTDLRGGEAVIGYVGSPEWVDFDLVFRAAAALPEATFVIIGATSADAAIGKNPPANIIFLGRKDYTSIPAYVDAFDVAIIPFKTGKIMNSADPVKLYEYFALGRPVVSTPIKQLSTYNDGRLLRMKDTAEEFVDAIANYLAFDDPNWQRERNQIARVNAWSAKASLILDCAQALDKQN